ncbi:DNA polymerase-4 [Naumannella cuiyingiana]|uniref:DNA polymerase IV n=1 Tax=Naumannella cuiyingiana TaxID=1347891 RepID=A0A7Z0D8Y9_9ACTN|nr:DNA polymerase-4 [Naumannella cuiyingiana]
MSEAGAPGGAGRAAASILHADLDAFYASVEQRDDPRLRGRPVIVGGGVVLAASYQAKARGVRTAMGGARARRLCPEAIVVPPRFAAYTEASRAVFAVFDDTTPLVEPISIDEAFLDVAGLRRIRGSPASIAARLRAQVRERVGLPITVGIATTKFLAKVASAVGKPDGLLEVPAGEELAFLHPLPVRRLWGVGEATAEKLAREQIVTVGQLAAESERRLAGIVGPGAARHLHALAHARDPRRVRTGVRRRSMGSQRAIGRGAHSAAELDAAVLGIVDGLGKRLRGAGRQARTVVLRLRFDDYSRVTRSHTLPGATSQTELIMTAARRLLRDALPLIIERGCTLIGITLANLDQPGSLQPTLPLDPLHDTELDAALDEVRRRWGRGAVTRGVLVGRDAGAEVPLLPD